MTAYPKGKLGTLNVLMFKKEIKVNDVYNMMVSQIMQSWKL